MLNSDQQRIIERILKDVQLGTKTNRKPLVLYVCGQAGTGKSHMIRHLVEHVGENVLVCAPTAHAARHINGKTVHAAFLLDPKSEKDDKGMDSISNLQLLIIDEISMVDATLLQRIERRMRQIMQNDNVAFGGCTVVFFGDLLQIPPVARFKNTNTPNWIFKSPIWKNLVEYDELEQIMRQEGDPEFGRMLQRWRVGVVTDEDRKFLDGKVREHSDCGYVDTVGYFCKRFDGSKQQMILAYKNKTNLGLNRAVTFRLFNPNDLFDVHKYTRTWLLTDYTSTVKSCFEFKIGVGSRVMVKQNVKIELSEEESIKLANGEMATVEDVEVVSGKVEVVTLKLSNGTVVDLKQVTTQSVRSKKSNKESSTVHFPMNLAYACTYHKAQGQTLHDVFLKSAGGLPPTLFYVGSSRVRTRDGLHIMDLGSANSIAADPEALAEYKRLRLSIGLPALPDVSNLVM